MSARSNRTRDTAIFGVFTALMLASKLVMEVLPNVHLLALFVGVLTAVYRHRALIPLYGYILLDGLIHGFSLWWVGYLYIFLPLFLGFLLVPPRLARAARGVLYTLVAALHGFSFGLLYLPTQVLVFGLTGKAEMLTWWVAGLPFDLIHGVSNALFSVLILPLSSLLQRLSKKV